MNLLQSQTFTIDDAEASASEVDNSKSPMEYAQQSFDTVDLQASPIIQHFSSPEASIQHCSVTKKSQRQALKSMTS